MHLNSDQYNQMMNESVNYWRVAEIALLTLLVFGCTLLSLNLVCILTVHMLDWCQKKEEEPYRQSLIQHEGK